MSNNNPEPEESSKPFPNTSSDSPNPQQSSLIFSDMNMINVDTVINAPHTNTCCDSTSTSVFESKDYDTATSMPELTSIHTERYSQRSMPRRSNAEMLYKPHKIYQNLMKNSSKLKLRVGGAKCKSSENEAEIQRIKQKYHRQAVEDAKMELTRGGWLMGYDQKDVEIFEKANKIEGLEQELAVAKEFLKNYESKSLSLKEQNRALVHRVYGEAGVSDCDRVPNRLETLFIWDFHISILRCMVAITSNLFLKAAEHALEALEKAGRMGKKSFIDISNYWLGLALYRAERYDEAIGPLRAATECGGERKATAKQLLNAAERYSPKYNQQESPKKAAEYDLDTRTQAERRTKPEPSLMNFKQRQLKRSKRPPNLNLTPPAYCPQQWPTTSHKLSHASSQDPSPLERPITAQNQPHGFVEHQEATRSADLDFPTPRLGSARRRQERRSAGFDLPTTKTLTPRQAHDELKEAKITSEELRNQNCESVSTKTPSLVTDTGADDDTGSNATSIRAASRMLLEHKPSSRFLFLMPVSGKPQEEASSSELCASDSKIG